VLLTAGQPLATFVLATEPLQACLTPSAAYHAELSMTRRAFLMPSLRKFGVA